MRYTEFKKLIDKYRLRPSVKRDLSLFSVSCISHAYSTKLRQAIGVHYPAVLSYGQADHYVGFYNLDYLHKQTSAIVRRHYPDLKPILTKAKNLYEKSRHAFETAERLIRKNPEKYLLALVYNYPIYMTSIGSYNCLWRYIGNDITTGNLPKRTINKITADREKTARAYPVIEKNIKISAHLIGKKYGFDGDLLRYLRYNELEQFLLAKIKNLSILRQAVGRRQGYAYFVGGSRQFIVTDRKILGKIRKDYLTVKKRPMEITGYPAFPGKVRGKVFNADTARAPKTKGSYILVIDHTAPGEIGMIKRSSAVVTNDGGILSHAAIMARELEIPCIIGTKIATQVLKNGDRVEVDVNKGIVKKLNKT